LMSFSTSKRFKKDPSKCPQYLSLMLCNGCSFNMAPGEHLILSNCGFEELEWSSTLYADYDTYSTFKRQFEETTIDLCLKQSLIGFFYKQFIDSAKLSKENGTVENEGSPKMLPWLDAVHLIPRPRPNEKHESKLPSQSADQFHFVFRKYGTDHKGDCRELEKEEWGRGQRCSEICLAPQNTAL